MRPQKRHAWPGFAVFAVLALLGLFVLHGPAAGITSLTALLAFIAACMRGLHLRQDPDAVAHNQRTGITGWLGGWW